jgi:hypothetical protein
LSREDARVMVVVVGVMLMCAGLAMAYLPAGVAALGGTMLLFGLRGGV